jgi:hypothetical protein
MNLTGQISRRALVLAAVCLLLAALPCDGFAQADDEADYIDEDTATVEELLGDQSEYGLTSDGQPLEEQQDEGLDEEPMEEAEETSEDEEADEEQRALDDEMLGEEVDELLPDLEDREPGADEARWGIRINAAVRANYVFNDSPDSFVINYAFEVQGQANADTAVMRGDAAINAEVEGFLSRWPTGECSLAVSIPKVPFEITFRKAREDKGSVSLKFRKAIMEDWKSSCSFTDAPGARFDTSGPPEKWLARAIEKARPPLRSIVADMAEGEETTSSFVIPKEVLDDPPLGSVEIEGTGVVTITPGG